MELTEARVKEILRSTGYVTNSQAWTCAKLVLENKLACYRCAGTALIDQDGDYADCPDCNGTGQRE